MSTSTAVSPVVVTGGVPDHGHDARVAVALWPGEGGRLLTSPIVMGGFVLAVLVASRFGPAGVAGFTGIVFGLFVFLAANLATLRTRREHMDEFVESFPASPAARTGGSLLALSWPALAMVLLTLGSAIWVGTRPPNPDFSPQIWDAAQGPLLVLCYGAIGVALARWLPSALVGLPGMVGLAMVTGAFVTSCGTAARCATVWFGPWVSRSLEDADGDFVGVRPGSPGWHLVYLIGLIAVISMLAVGRDRRGLLQVMAVVAGLAMVVIAGILQLP